MSYEEFIQKWTVKIYPIKSAYLRKGQCLMNYLAVSHYDLYKEITNTEYDCFHRDDLIPKTLEYLKKNWREIEL